MASSGLFSGEFSYLDQMHCLVPTARRPQENRGDAAVNALITNSRAQKMEQR
jgi:hypothetical protein